MYGFPDSKSDRDYEIMGARGSRGAVAFDEAPRRGTRIKSDARTTRAKYLEPPGTTDFSSPFLLPGLSAEVRAALFSEFVQRESG